MGEKRKLLPSEMRILDRTGREFAGEILVPFAIDDLISREVGQGAAPLLHLWTHKQALVAGIRDGKLPYADLALKELQAQGYNTGIRHSGGAAVPLDEGVLNVSLIIPKAAGAMDFREDFIRMVQLIDRSVKVLGMQLQQGEVVGSYCPGDYDLSVAGLKFCGIAQRRQSHAIAIQAFIVVEGNGEQRIRVVQQFYQKAVGEKTEANYPRVSTGTMSSLAELGAPGLTVDKFKEIILAQVREDAHIANVNDEIISPSELSNTVEAIRRRYTS